MLTGPKAGAVSSRGGTRPLVIEEVFLFDAQKLIEALRSGGAKLGVASSVPARFWEEARIYPPSAAASLHLSDAQLDLLRQFAG